MAIEGESIGTARIDIIADTAAFEAEIARAKSQVATLGPAGEASFQQMTAAQKRATIAALQFEQGIGKSADEIKLLSLAARGAAPEALERLRQKMLDVRTASAGSALDAARFSDAQILSANRALAAFKTQSDAAKTAAAAQAELAAADNARFQKIAADATAEVEARQAVTAATMEQARANAALAESQGLGTAGNAAQAIGTLEATTVKQQIADYAALDAVMTKKVATTEEVAAAEAALDRLQAAGMISNEQLAETFAALDVVTAAETKSLQANSVAQVENAAATTVNSRTQYELGIMLGEVASGNVNRLKRSTAALANSTGLLKAIMTPAGLGITAGIAALALFGKAVYDREQDLLAFDKALAATGDFAASTGIRLQGVAALVGESTGRYSDANKAVLALAKSGDVLGSQMQEMATTAVNMAYLTGESIDKVVKDLISLQGDPTQAIAKTTAAMGLLTTAQYNEIVETQQQQGASAAAALAMKDLGDASDSARVKLVENAGVVIRTWQGFKTMLGDIGRDIASIGASQSVAQQIASLQNQLKQAYTGAVGGGNPNPDQDPDVVRLRAQIASLQKQQQSDAMFAAGQELANQAKQKHDQALAEALKSDKQGDEGFIAQANAINRKRYEALVGVVDPSIRDRVNAAYDQQIRDAVKRANEQLPHGGHGRTRKDPSINAFAEFQQQVASLTAKSSDAGNSAVSAYTQGVLKLVAGFDKATKSGKNVAAATALYDQGIKALGADLAAATAKQNASIKAYQDALNAENAARKEEMDLQIASYGLSQQEAQRMQELAQITEQVTRQITALTAQRNKLLAESPNADTTVIDAEIKAQKDSLATQLADKKMFYQETDSMQANSLLGMKAGIADFMATQRNMYEQSRQFTTDFINGFGNAFAQFASGSESAKKAFGDFIDSMYQQALKFLADKAIQSLFDSFNKNPSDQTPGTTNGGWSSILGNFLSYFSNSGTTSGTSIASSYLSNGGASYAASGVDWGIGALATGGPAMAGGVYKVAEDGPEVLNVGSQSYLMMGSKSGSVTPNSALKGAGGGPVTVNQTVVVNGLSSRRTREQLAQETARRQRIATARNS